MKTILFAILSLSLMGCVTIDYTSPTGERFSYFRTGDQQISEMTVSRDQSGKLKVELGRQESTGNVDVELVRIIQSLLPLAGVPVGGR